MRGTTLTNTPGELIRTVALVTGVAEATVTTYHRSLREAGLITKGGRGTSAARPTPRDAARLLLAIGGSRFEKQAADKIVQEFSLAKAQCRVASTSNDKGLFDQWVETEEGTTEFPGMFLFDYGAHRFNFPSLSKLPEGHSFEDALAGLIVAAIRCEFSRFAKQAVSGADPFFNIKVSFFGPTAHASIEVHLVGVSDGTTVFDYKEELLYYRDDLVDQEGGGDLTIRRDLSERTIFELGRLLRTDYYRGSDIEGYPLDPFHPWYETLTPEEKERRWQEIDREQDRWEATTGG